MNGILPKNRNLSVKKKINDRSAFLEAVKRIKIKDKDIVKYLKLFGPAYIKQENKVNKASQAISFGFIKFPKRSGNSSLFSSKSTIIIKVINKGIKYQNHCFFILTEEKFNLIPK